MARHEGTPRAPRSGQIRNRHCSVRATPFGGRGVRRSEDRLLKCWPELQIVSRSSHAKGLRRRVCTTSGKVATEFQSDSSRTDSPVRILSTRPTQATTVNLPLIGMVRVKPFDPAAPKLRFQLSDGSVDLMKAFSLGGFEGIGAWKMPTTDETFDARFGR
jgi:hypothetical protein